MFPNPAAEQAATYPRVIDFYNQNGFVVYATANPSRKCASNLDSVGLLGLHSRGLFQADDPLDRRSSFIDYCM